jgi:hypothetical protein
LAKEHSSKRTLDLAIVLRPPWMTSSSFPCVSIFIIKLFFLEKFLQKLSSLSNCKNNLSRGINFSGKEELYSFVYLFKDASSVLCLS